MRRNEQLRQLMQQLYVAEQEFRSVWESSKARDFNNGQPYNIFELSQEQIDAMFSANHQAYTDAGAEDERRWVLVREFY
jgi:hypothetical protein